jgi:hypothetical protein
MNKLPNPIQDIIWNHYWQFEFNNVVQVINQPYLVEYKSINFFEKYRNVLNSTYKENYKHYFKVINNNIKSVINNKGLNIICKQNNLLLRYINIDYINKVFEKVPNDYKYIAALFVLMGGHTRYVTLNNFQNINKCISL